MFQIKYFYIQYKCLHVKYDQHNHKYLTEDKAHVVVKYIFIYLFLCTQSNFIEKLSQYQIWSVGSFRTRTDVKLPDKWAYMTSP